MMRGAHRLAGVGAITCALTAVSFPAFAQTARSSLTAMHEYVAAEIWPDDLAIPPNLEFGGMFRPLLESMLRRSPTFRRQCLRIAGEPSVSVRFQAPARFWTQAARAITNMVRRDGRLEANIYIADLDNRVELIAHELEHVIEQLDQIDLHSRAALPDSGVHQVEAKAVTFETTRATRVGLQVAREVQTSDRRAD